MEIRGSPRTVYSTKDMEEKSCEFTEKGSELYAKA